MAGLFHDIVMMAKYSISDTELAKDVSHQNPQDASTFGNLIADPVFQDKYPHMTLRDPKAHESMKMCKKCFRNKSNPRLPPIFLRLQITGESLYKG